MIESRFHEQFQELRNEVERAIELKVEGYTNEHPFECNILLDFGYFGLGSAYIPSIDSIWIDEDGDCMVENREDGDLCEPLYQISMDNLMNIYDELECDD